MFLVIETLDPDAFCILHRYTRAFREVCRSARLNTLTETAEWLNALEDEIVDDMHQKHAEASVQYGSPDLRLQGAMRDVKLATGLDRLMMDAMNADPPDDDGDGDDDDDSDDATPILHIDSHRKQ